MLQELKSEHTKQIIINEAFKMFYENGFKSSSVDKIMKGANLTKGAFYHHYKNKQELGLAVIALKLQKRVHENMILPLYQKGDALKILEETFLNRLKSFSLYYKKHGCPMNNFINEIGDYEICFQTALQKIIEEWKTALIELIDRGKKENTINNNVPSSAVATYLISSFEGIRGIRKLYDNDIIIDDYILALSLYLKQLKA